MANPIAQMIVRLYGDTKQFHAAMSGAQAKLAATGAKMSAAGAMLTKKLTLPIIAVGAAAGVSAYKLDKAMNNIRVGTGKTGKALENLGEDFRTVLKRVPQDADQVSKVLADIQTRTGLTGKPLQKLTEQILTLGRVTGEDAAELVRVGTRVFGDWSIATKDQSDALDHLYKTSQSTGIGVTQLSNLVVTYGAPFRQLGYDFETTAALMGKWEKEGVNVEKVAAGLRMALGRMAKAGQEPTEMFPKLIEQIQNAGTAGEANAIAVEAFGSRAGPDMAAAIREGRFEVDKLVKDLQGSKETINAAGKDTLTLGDRFKILKNNVMVAIEPLGKALLGALEKLMPAFEGVVRFVSKLIEGFGKLPDWVQKAAIGFGVAAAAAGPLLSVGGRLVTTIGRIAGAIGKIGGGLAGFFSKAGGAAGRAAGDFSSLGATTAATGGKMMGLAGTLGIAGLAIGGAAAATWGAKAAMDAKWKAFGENMVAASKLTGELDTLRDTTNSLTVGTEEHTAAMEAQRAKAEEVVEAAGGMGAIFDETGQIIDADTDLINMLAGGYSNLSPEVAGLQAEQMKGKATAADATKVYESQVATMEEAKKKIDDMKLAYQEKVANGEELSRVEQAQLAGLTRDYWEHQANVDGAFKSMKKIVDDFGKKITGPGGPSKMTKKDLADMRQLMANNNPQVRDLGLQMFQQIVNAQKEKSPEIAGKMDEIMTNVRERIEALPARERTADKMQEIINAESEKHPEIAGAMRSIMDGVESQVRNTDLRGAARAVIDGIRAVIGDAKLPPIRLFTSGGPVPSFAGGGQIQSLAGGGVPIIAHRGEFVQQESAVRKYGLDFMRAVNEGLFQPGGDTHLTVNLNSVSPDYDAERFIDIVARRGAHLGRVMRKRIS
jgi:TP901 family phage tail tape measure protein